MEKKEESKWDFVKAAAVAVGYLIEYLLVSIADNCDRVTMRWILIITMVGVFGIAYPMDVMGIEPTKRSVPVAALLALIAIAVAFAARFS